MMKLAPILFLTLAGFQSAPTTAPSAPSTQPTTRAGWIPAPVENLLTVAETSDFTATSTHDEVVDLMDKLAERSDQARRLSMGQTQEGREIPVIVFADPPVATAAEARRAAERGRPTVLLFGNIHGGEVDAKEALLMLARELATADGPHPLLEDLVIAIAPIYNADGNDKFGDVKTLRSNQDGPEEGVGTRQNAQGLDLNRDFVKLEAPETRGLVKFLREWDPAIVFDGHATNGSLHRFLITYAGPKVPAGDAQLIDYTNEQLLPALTQGLKERPGIDAFYYGNFADEHRQWASFPAVPRYGTNYIGLRNRLSVLSESYSYASYEERIRGSYEFAKEVLLYAAENRREIQRLVREADERARRADGEVALRVEAVAFEEPGTILGYEESREDGQRVAGEPREYEVEVLDKWVPTLSVERPFAYLVPAELKHVIENLQRHGIEVETLREELELEVTTYTVNAIERAARNFEGHKLVTLDVTSETQSQRVEAGGFVVRTAQPLGSLAAYLLEPQAEDGLVAWNFFDDALEEGEAFPVRRIEQERPLLTTPARPLPEEQPTPRPISYEVLNGRDRPNFNGGAIGGLRWVDDDHYLQRIDRTLMRVEAETGRLEPFHDVEAMAEALAELPTIDRETARRMASGSRFDLSDDFSKVLLNHENDLYVYDLEEEEAVRLTSTPEAEELAEFSPDGEFVAFVQANNLYVVDVATQTERALTTGGTDTLRNGKADWVYFEELFGRSWKAYWWSPDSMRIAFLQTDASMVASYTLVNDLPEPLAVEVVRYPKPGTPNPQVKLGIVTAAGGDVRWADLSQYTPADFLISGVGWWPDASRAYFFGQNREQTWMDLATVSHNGGEPTRLLRDQTEAWVSPEGGPWVLEDGSFLLLSDRSGWRHLYHFDRTGKLINPVTQGEWDVRGVERVDEAGGVVYVTGTKDSHIASNLYHVSIEDQSIERLTQAPGSHSITMNESGTRYIDSWSSRNRPTQVALYAADGQRQRMLDLNPVYAIESFIWGEEEQFQIETDDGFLLEAALVKPANFDSSKKYPIWMTTYAGPYAPSIRDTWGGGRTWDQMLAHEGIVVMRVDPRPASGKGPQSAWTAYRQLGVQETKDLESAIAWLEEQPWADTSRVGLSGHSYGGYMTSYAMTHSDKFAAGIAGAPVTDWRDYDSIYTERYMGTPQSNPEGYKVSSAVEAAGELEGRLLLIHGAMDDNVHPQNTMRFVRALQRAEKPFDLMLYPGARHGIGGGHYSRLTFDFIRETMGVMNPPVTQPPGDDRQAGAE